MQGVEASCIHLLIAKMLPFRAFRPMFVTRLPGHLDKYRGCYNHGAHVKNDAIQKAAVSRFFDAVKCKPRNTVAVMQPLV